MYGGTNRVVYRTWANIQKGWKDISDATRWVVHKGTKVKLFEHCRIPNLNPIRHYIEGPLKESEYLLNVVNIKGNGGWKPDDSSIAIPQDIQDAISFFLL